MEYSCMMWNILALVYSVVCIVESQFPPDMFPPDMFPTNPNAPVLNTTPETVIVKEGDNATLPCKAQNAGSTDTSWLTSGYQLLTTGDKTQTDDTRLSVNISRPGEWNLTIANTRKNDSGIYICMLQTFPPQEKLVTLVVNTPPAIDKDKLKARYLFQKGESLTVTCSVSGYPKPEVKWYNVKTDYSTMEEIKEFVSPNSLLTFAKLKASDGGIYGCEAKSEAGDDMYEIFLQEVYEPKMNTTNRTIVVKEYSDVLLQCEILSNPPAQVGWQRDEKILHTNWKYNVAMYAESEIKKVTELTIRSATASDRGEYLCLAQNPYGRNRIKYRVIVEVMNTTTQPTKTTTATTKTPSTSTTSEPEPADRPLISSTTQSLKELPDHKEKDTTPTEIKYTEGPKTGASHNHGPINTYSYTLICSVCVTLVLLLS